MKSILSLIGLFLILFVPTLPARAQVEASPVWQVLRYDITASVQADRSLSAHAVISVRNVGRGAGARITLRMSPKAVIKAATFNDAVASFRPSQDERANQQKVEVTLAQTISPGDTFNVALDYTLPVTDSNGLAAISPLGAQFLPLSFWYPTPTNPFVPRGADTAPFRLKVTNAAGDFLSSGKMSAGTFEQTLYGQPFFLAGSWETSEGAGDARGITAYLPKGASAEERKQAEALTALAGAARAFYAGLLGNAPDAPVRLVAVTRGAGFNDSGTLLLDAAAFRRPKIDAVTAMQVAETLAHLWLGGSV
ncbi:MAG: hypothetical protein JOZ52_08420, partial [Acidobacteria bacterium]|nr:hypothetical protein [Acidobacteriota bacterium]